jgi:hypothetical protein
MPFEQLVSQILSTPPLHLQHVLKPHSLHNNVKHLEKIHNVFGGHLIYTWVHSYRGYYACSLRVWGLLCLRAGVGTIHSHPL